MVDKKPILDARDLSFVYPETKVYANYQINLTVHEGECVGIAGASGAGKTTLCMALSGAIPHLVQGFMEGEVFVDGLNIRETSVSELARHVGIVMQEPESQLFSLSVFADVTFGLENLKFSPKEIIERAEWALDVVGMLEFKDRQSSRLSGGQKQRVALACTLALGSKLVILDEPTSELDPIGTEEVFNVVNLLRSRGVTIVVVEQKVEQLVQIVDRLVYMQGGQMILNKPPREFFMEARARYFNGELDIYTPQVTELAYQLSERSLEIDPLPLTVEDFMASYPRKTV